MDSCHVGVSKTSVGTLRQCVRGFVYIVWSIAWLVAPAALDTLKRLSPRVRDFSFRAFFARERLWSYLWPERKLKILFSCGQDLERVIKTIKNEFYNSSHVIAFEAFSTHNIRQYDLIVPLNVSDLKYLSEHRDLVHENPIAIPSMESILLCDDKVSLNETLVAKGFGGFLPKMGGELIYPYILKKRVDLFGRNSHLIFNKYQEEAFSDIVTHPEYFSQNFIKGSYEYATHILFKNQRIVHSLNIEYKFKTDMPIKGKDKPIYTMICHCPYLHIFAAMLTSIGFNGLCCVNYKVFDNHLFLLEINPRFGGSLSSYFSSFIRYVA